jgi:hypothetical protein
VLRPGGALVISDITLADSTRHGDIPAADIEAALLQGYGPWPDLWSVDADHRGLAAAAGLRTTDMRDVTENTRPSHRFTSPGGEDDGDAGGHDPGDLMRRAGRMLRRLHYGGHLRSAYMRFDKPAA